MNCQTIQNKILTLPDPRHVPDSLRAHVGSCGACKVWAELAGRLEGILERLPTPSAPRDKKAALIANLMKQQAKVEVASKQPSRFRDFIRQNATLVGSLAAAVLVAVGFWAMPKNGPKPDVAIGTPKDPFLEKMVQRDVALAKATTHAQKFQALGGLADDLSTEARGLARIANPEELKDVARWFDRVVNVGMIKQAEKMPDSAMSPAEKKTQLTDLARKLGQTADEMKKATGEVSPEAKPILERIADTARFGQKKLQDLAG
ncbi:MAG: hypothetical protein K8U57_37510 [Planctomycetes bacterium]|nr:hypothetical protein [Planctomycetota bacterium]